MYDLSLRDPGPPTAAGRGTPPPGLRQSPPVPGDDLQGRRTPHTGLSYRPSPHTSRKFETAIVTYPVYLGAGSAVGPINPGIIVIGQVACLTPLNACLCQPDSAPLLFDAVVGVIWFHSPRLKGLVLRMTVNGTSRFSFFFS